MSVKRSLLVINVNDLPESIREAVTEEVSRILHNKAERFLLKYNTLSQLMSCDVFNFSWVVIC